MRNRQATYLLACSVYMLVGSCYNDKADRLYAPVSCKADTAIISFKNDLIPVFTSSCALSGCHTGPSPEGHLVLDSAVAFANLSKPGSGYIDTSAPESSLLYTSLLSTTEPMPPTGKLNDCNLKMILKWLREKAPDN